MRNTASNQIPTTTRPLRLEEYLLIHALLYQLEHSEHLLRELDSARVSDMKDGAMGSLRFVGEDCRILGSCLVEATYLDSDGVLVSIALNSDDSGSLFELDVWKVDFSPLLRYPTFEQVAVRKNS